VAERVVPVVAVERLAQPRRAGLQAGRERVVGPGDAGQARGAEAGVVRVALDLAGRYGLLRQAAVGELHRLARVLPVVVPQALGGADAVLQVAVAVQIPVPVQSSAARAVGSRRRTRAASPVQRSYSSSTIRKRSVASCVP
jgi:hypothetical protein